MTRQSIKGRDASRGDVLTVHFEDGYIAAVERKHDPNASDLPVLASGFVDAQVNGYMGMDVNAPDADSTVIEGITGELARIGVTTWVPTIITASEEAISHALRYVEKARNADARVRDAIPCVHVEGPFISDHDGARGVHDASQVRAIDPEEVRRWAAITRIGVVTVSPHWPDTPRAIEEICSMGIRVSIGHTHAGAAEVLSAIDAGASLSTHLGNGIAAMIPRHPNAIWTQLADDRVTCGLIADGHHLPPETIEVMLRAKGPRGAFLVSDTTAIAGNAPGRYETPVGGSVDLDEHGRLSYVGTELLAGAAASLPDGLRNVVRSTSVSLGQALKLVTENPARSLPGARPGLGTLQPGAPADMVLVSDSGAVLEVIRSSARMENIRP
ncbi:N-acetylglucosamine-6-phosphate deacetylase [Arthrobacter sp. W4I7]|uniref:N-acetylglucosamine-6-phosphate deacetylase n=1 Tax=Arthrobacter sp. W4I7 TaxID=3042296 RepID=UPI00278885C9|nr:amidohydrolase family protein [Arthrobacter sp. W4I7]MDQ0689411.1 N-acetylglucosamine-6-phosphate deacetylase [Arthrobacter sp. W4I7]